MVIDNQLKQKNLHLKEKLENIKVVLTDNDGVLTDTGVYYSAKGEELKRFSIRDGMGIERLRKYAGVETIIVTGEESGSVKSRAEKLKITEYYLGIKKKEEVLSEVMKKHNLKINEIAFVGDDSNDVEVMKLVGFRATPSNGMSFIKEIADYVCENTGGNGAFREVAELIIAFKNE
ncbi:MAG: HAD-IIIA family hydrolase [Ignavibacteriaceae bacterium]|jgi:YrbI family 3-deoxy-D-manno-octulosonate 8-phosphate phosphatase|nr:HAD-IIIA family hydrolase [Ignavibacteriaceae bacterium]MCU0364296.1 HAD-IIIA family hydrolase [Ignavibacteriaceae bacterium]MCU0405849.1 HAD-IIIA family hydrolase [Ignavibacteriaceae bacterium]MCU0412866.1 HAD-IIIA family hydrolase [Ignavibacteriaceae bacterium]